MATSGVPALDRLLSAGYPDKSAVLVVGPPGIGKEALGYWFTSSGLSQGDACLYVTHRVVSDVLKDMEAFGVRIQGDALTWVARAGSPLTCDLNDLAGLSSKIKNVIQSQTEKNRLRIAMDVLSPLLVLNPSESMYRFWSQLLAETKEKGATLFATMEEGMHPASLVTSMEQLFDGVIEMRVFEEGLAFTPLLRVRKMLGVQPLQMYFRFSFTRDSMEIAPDVK